MHIFIQYISVISLFNMSCQMVIFVDNKSFMQCRYKYSI